MSGHSPLSWTAEAHIALDAARGIEYIHDHTKVCYVHRDIKTSDILLDWQLRAKVIVCMSIYFSLSVSVSVTFTLLVIIHISTVP